MNKYNLPMAIVVHPKFQLHHLHFHNINRIASRHPNLHIPGSILNCYTIKSLNLNPHCQTF